MGGQTRQHTLGDMVFEELPIVATETTVATKRLIRKETLARTAKTAAKKKPAKKAAKKPKAKKAKKAKKPKAKKKKKKKKAKKERFVGGKRKKGQRKFKSNIAAGKKTAAAQKKKGIGLFKPVSCSAALSAITGIKGKSTRGQIFKALWVHIKKKGLNKGRNVGKIDGIFGGGSMFKLPGAVSKHIK